MSHATHANAALTPRARLRLGQLVIDQGWPIARAAERFDVSWRTAHKWAERYRIEGTEGMRDRSSAPRRQHHRTSPRMVRRIVSLRRRHRLGPVAIGDLLGIPASTVHAVLVRCRLNRLTHLDRATGELIRRYERDAPGDLIHVDQFTGTVPFVSDRGGLAGPDRLPGHRVQDPQVAHAVAAQDPRDRACRHSHPRAQHVLTLTIQSSAATTSSSTRRGSTPAERRLPRSRHLLVSMAKWRSPVLAR